MPRGPPRSVYSPSPTPPVPLLPPAPADQPAPPLPYYRLLLSLSNSQNLPQSPPLSSPRRPPTKILDPASLLSAAGAPANAGAPACPGAPLDNNTSNSINNNTTSNNQLAFLGLGLAAAAGSPATPATDDADRQTATIECPKSMVGRVIGKNGDTIKALQLYTGALIQIDQTVDPTRVTVSGAPGALATAVAMVTDIVKGTFKGFALLRQQLLQHQQQQRLLQQQQQQASASMHLRMSAAAQMSAGSAQHAQQQQQQGRPVYAPGYGLIPPSQVRESIMRRERERVGWGIQR